MKKTFLVAMMLVFLLSACNLPFGTQTPVMVSPSETDAFTTVEETVAPPVETIQSTSNSAVEVTPVSTGAASVLGESDSGEPVLLFGIGMHVEPFGETAQGFAGSGKGVSDYNDQIFFNQHVDYIRSVTDIVAAHGGVMTIQVQSPFTEEVILTDNPILRNLSARGFELALHFHEDAHLGKNSAALGAAKWCEVMKQEINLIKKAGGVDEVHYWSGGNLYPRVFQAADCAGLSVNGDWKSPVTQTTDLSLLGIHPWRPADGTDGSDFSGISTNDPDGPIVFLPEGLFDREAINAIKKSEAAGGDEAYFAYLEQTLLASLAAARADRVNVFHFTIHAAEFKGDPAHPFAVVEKFLTEVVDPLVASGQVQWATFSQMEEAYRIWETANPGVDPRSE